MAWPDVSKMRYFLKQDNCGCILNNHLKIDIEINILQFYGMNHFFFITFNILTKTLYPGLSMQSNDLNRCSKSQQDNTTGF